MDGLGRCRCCVGEKQCKATWRGVLVFATATATATTTIRIATPTRVTRTKRRRVVVSLSLFRSIDASGTVVVSPITMASSVDEIAVGAMAEIVVVESTVFEKRSKRKRADPGIDIHFQCRQGCLEHYQTRRVANDGECNQVVELVAFDQPSQRFLKRCRRRFLAGCRQRFLAGCRQRFPIRFAGLCC